MYPYQSWIVSIEENSRLKAAQTRFAFHFVSCQTFRKILCEKHGSPCHNVARRVEVYGGMAKRLRLVIHRHVRKTVRKVFDPEASPLMAKFQLDR